MNEQPRWLDVLREQCESHSQEVVGHMIGYSDSVVSQVLRGVYPGDVSRVEEAVKGALLGATVECPVVGEIPRHRCLEHQARAGKPAITNPARIQLSKTCPTCPNRMEPRR